MLNNDIFVSLLYILQTKSQELIRLLKLAEANASPEQMVAWLHK